MFDFAAWQRSHEITESECADILTWTDEPELIAEPGETPPTFDPLDVAAARLASRRMGLRLAWTRMCGAPETPDSRFVESFRYWRASARRDNPKSYYSESVWKDAAGQWQRGAMPAREALNRAYGDILTGAKRYAPSPVATGYGRPAAAWNTPGDGRRLRFVDSPAEIGAREVGSYDEIARKAGRRADHTAWYCDSSQDETYTGYALQIPGRNGRPRFLAAYKESCSGGFVVELDPIEGEPGGRWSDSAAEQGAIDAASRGDSIAEREAEKARDYDSAWQAGSRWRDLRDEIGEARRAFLALIRDAKAKCGALGKDSPVFAAVREALESRLDEIREAREMQTKLAAGEVEYAWFYPRDQTLCAAFNEAAGREVLA